MNVLFYGSFLPLHGVDIMLTAAYLLKDMPITFTLIGGRGKSYRNFFKKKKCLKLNNIIHYKWVPYQQLPLLIRRSDVCLCGPFGDTTQSHLVITGKTFQCMAMSKPVIIGKINDDYGFRDKENCLLVPQGNEKNLADALVWCFDNKEKLSLIGKNGLILYRNKFSIDFIKNIIEEILD